MANTIISQPPRFSFSKNIMALNVNTDLGDGATVKIWVSYAIGNGLGGTISGQALYEETLSADADGNVTFYLQNQLDAVLKNHIPKWGDDCKKMSSNWATYTIQIRDYDSNGTYSGVTSWIGDTQGDEYFVYHGGVSYEQFTPSAFFDWIDTDKAGDHTQRFWTWFENNREVGINEPHWLSFMAQAVNGYTAPTLTVKCYYEDGTNNTYTKVVNVLTSCLKGELYILPTGYDMLVDWVGGGMSRYNGSASPVIKYEVWLFENGGDEPLITEKKTFIVDWNYRKKAKFFFFSNSLGCVDSIRLFWGETMGAEYTTNNASGVMKYDYYSNSPLPATNFNFNTSEQVFKKANSGDSLRKSDLDAMRQLSLSDNIYEIVGPGKLNPNVRMLPINSTSKKIAYYKRTPNSPIYQLELEYQYAFTNVSYTPENMDCNNPDLPMLYRVSEYFGAPTVYYQINFQVAALGIVRYAGPTENLTTASAMVAWLNANWGDVATFELDGSSHMVCKCLYPITMFTIS